MEDLNANVENEQNDDKFGEIRLGTHNECGQIGSNCDWRTSCFKNTHNIDGDVENQKKRRIQLIQYCSPCKMPKSHSR